MHRHRRARRRGRWGHERRRWVRASGGRGGGWCTRARRCRLASLGARRLRLAALGATAAAPLLGRSRRLLFLEADRLTTHVPPLLGYGLFLAALRIGAVGRFRRRCQPPSLVVTAVVRGRRRLPAPGWGFAPALGRRPRRHRPAVGSCGRGDGVHRRRLHRLLHRRRLQECIVFPHRL